VWPLSTVATDQPAWAAIVNGYAVIGEPTMFVA
jgi:hypothetical protein